MQNLNRRFYYNYHDKLIKNGKLELILAQFICCYLFSIIMLNLFKLILYVLIKPQLITFNKKSNRDLVYSLKLILKQKLYQYMSILNNQSIFYIFEGWVLEFGTFHCLLKKKDLKEISIRDGIKLIHLDFLVEGKLRNYNVLFFMSLSNQRITQLNIFAQKNIIFLKNAQLDGY
ncbi:unnamed protein product [Paramecium sonneborni]|uniref:Transmembrane protein n=1 Tax=Paramecium sonneborni TaxID=65129 RepID=A0A8S1LJG9_9CILI|nr:unnamed protein product [Paramecium sonneborni]